jgi:Rrf2 family transcriptional regulator, cysteine metabolism repressor
MPFVHFFTISDICTSNFGQTQQEFAEIALDRYGYLPKIAVYHYYIAIPDLGSVRMTLLNRKVDYALLILSYLYRRTEGGSAREIADRFELSRAFVANILKLLCGKGFVTSHRGVKGGYVLGRPAEEVTLAQLMDALDDSFNLTECNKASAGDWCSLIHICPVRNAIGEVHRRIREVLGKVTLAEIFGQPGGDGHTQFGLTVAPLEQLAALAPAN